jgi:T5SS/PEP-CTERM-associated repeat protein
MNSAARVRFYSVAAARCVVALFFFLAAESVRATITNTGTLTNAPNTTTGVYAGSLTVGDGAFGSVAATAGSTITGTGGITIGNAVDGVGQISLSGFGTDLSMGGSTADVTLGDEGAGVFSLTSQARALTADDTFVGAAATGAGKLTVDGFGTLYDAADDFTVGVNGVGIVDVTGGGAINSDVLTVGDLATGQGTVAVSGELSRWSAANVTVADAGAGALNVDGGGRFTSSGTITVGQLAGSVGSVDLSGAGTLVTSAGLIVGANGTGSFTVRDGARYTSSTTVNITQDAASVGRLVVTGANSRFSTPSAVSTSLGEAKIVVADGGVISAGTGFVVNSTGSVELDGGRLETTLALNTAINVSGALAGSGTLDAQGVTVGSGGRLGVDPGDRLEATGLVASSGLIDLDGGELVVRGVLNNNGDVDARNGAVLRVGSTGFDNNSGNQLSIAGGQVDVYGAFDNNAGATIAVVGGSTGVFHDAVTNNGAIFVSASSEIVLLENLSFVPTSTLGVQLASIAPQGDPTDAFGLTSVGGATTLAGTLSVSLASGFVAVPGATYEILASAGGVTGMFATETLPTLGGGLSLDVVYTPDSVLLSVVGVSGDFDFDGDVDGADLLVWQRGGSPTPNSPGDLAAWKSNFGFGASAAAAATVPEPGAALLVLGGLPWAAWRRKGQ